MHKHLTGDEKQVRYLLDDIVNRLEGATELQIWYAVEHFINRDDSEFFPVFAKLRKAIFEDNAVYGRWRTPKDGLLEGWDPHES